MNKLSKQSRERLAKVFTSLTAVTTMLSLSGVAYLAPVAYAVAPADYGLMEGDVISAAGSNDPDVYIVNEMGYKRLFLNPAIFGFYGHLGGFAAVKNVSAVTRDAFVTSGLFRNCETGDEKVYGVETTGEDTGMLHWVNTSGAQAVADDPDFFSKVFCINSNEFNWYSKGSDYTSVNDVPDYTRSGVTPTPVPGNVTASLAPGNPAATTVTTNAQGIEYLRVRLSGTGTVNEVVVKRLGAGATGDFGNVYLYDGATRLTSGKSISAATGEVTFANLKVSVSGTKDLSVVADLSSATAGNVNYFSVISMSLASGTVSGLPTTGNVVSVSGAASGRIDVAKTGSLPNPNVGAQGVQVSEFKLTANTEGASVKRITMLQGGTVKPGDLANVKLKAGTNEWVGTMTSDGYAVFDLGSGLFIAKGGDQVFKVYVDFVGAKKNETTIFYFENATDILAVGDQYGFGMNAASGTSNQGIDAFDTTTEAHTITLQGGVLTITFNGPTAQNVGTNTTDTVLLRYSMTAATNIEVRRTKLVLCSDDDGSGVFDNSDEGEVQANWDDLTDIKIVDEDTGATIVGPKDGTAFDDADNTNSACSATADGTQENFSDVYELTAGKTYNFKVTGDINTANGGNLDAGDAIKVVLANWTTSNGNSSPATADVTVMKYSGTNTAVADADIVPQADISGPVLTIQASSLTLGLSSAIGKQTVVRGTQDVNAVGLTFSAGQASALTVTDIILTGYFDEDGAGAFTVGSDGTTSVADMVSSVKIYEIESGTIISSTPSSNQLSNTTGTVTFNGLSWMIPAGETKTLGVRVDLGSNPLADTDYFSFDINTTTDVTALDSSSKTVNAGNADPNGATPSVYVTNANAGSMTVAVAPDTPSSHAVYWGQTGDVIGKWRFSATNEAFLLEKVQFNEDDAGQRTDVTNNVKTVYLEYKNKAGSTVTQSGTFNSAASVAFGFSGTNRPYVPKGGSLDVTLKGDFKTSAEGATSASQSVDFFHIAFRGDTGTGTNTFRAVGEGSGTVLQGNSAGITDQDQTNGVRVYRVFPEFAFIAPSSTKLTTNDPVLTFTITAKGLPDSKLFFDNQAAGSGSLRFEVVASGVGVSADPAFTVRDAADNSIIDTGTITNAPATAPRASLTVNFGNNGTGKDIEISGGSSKTFKIFLDTITDFNTPLNTTAGVGADYFQLVLRDENDATNSLVSWVDNSTNATTDADTTWDSTTGFANGYFRLLPMAGYQFTAQ